MQIDPTSPGDPGNEFVVPLVADDAPCRTCGYNVRGLPINGLCPECATPVAVSIGGVLLKYANPQWVSTLRAGARLIIWGVVAIIVGGIITGILAAAVGRIGAIAGVLVVAGYVMTLWGSWKLTEPDPSGLGEDEYGTARRIVRFALIVGIVLMFVGIVSSFATLPPPVFTTIQVLQALGNILSVISLAAQLYYLKHLVMRVPDFKMRDRANFLMYALTITVGMMQLMGIISLFTGPLIGPGAGGGPMAGVVIVSCGFSIAVLVFMIMYLLLVERIARRFGQEARLAEQNWRASANPGPLG